MRGLLAGLLLAALAGPAAADCGFRPKSAPETLGPIAALPEGVISGEAVCDGLTWPMAVWTMAVDGTSADLGIRDRPLFRGTPANPLVEVGRATVGGARMTIFQRQTTTPADQDGADRRPPFRLFGTICDEGAAEPLDCSSGSARIRMRANVIDTDGDGTLDRVRHQVSIYDGADRLQVLMFETPHAGRPLANAVPWIEALRLAGML